MSKADAQVLDDLLTSRGQFGHREHLELAWIWLEPDLRALPATA